MQKQEITINYKWIDFAKFVSISLIIFFHTPPSISGFEGILLSHLRLPAFFFLSGILFRFDRHPSFSGFFKHRGKQLLIPYFCFFILFYLYWIFLGRKFSSPEEAAMPLYEPLLEYLYGRPFLVCLPLWFLAALFSMQCLYYLFQGKNKTVSLVILFLLSFIPAITNISQTPWMLDNVCSYFIYYGIGNLFKKEVFRFMKIKARFLIGFALIALHIACNFLLQQSCPVYIKIPLDLLCSFSAIIPLFILIKLITDNWGIPRLIKYIGANTVILLAFHTYGIRVCALFMSHFMPSVPESYASKTIITLFVLISMLPLVFIINKYFPFVIGRGKLFDQPQ
jgi:fucose 4-O-acetylase-like acetyltransferase